jgi:mono/diheme cytochrome c family protein
MNRLRVAPIAIILAGLAACAPAAPPQSAPTTSPPASSSAPSAMPTSTLNGVFSSEQAIRGRRMYLGQCRSCHNPSTGEAFEKAWAGKTVADLFTYIFEAMPPNDPRTISSTDDADLIGFLLQSAGLPPGSRDLPASRDSLRSIRIEVKK